MSVSEDPVCGAYYVQCWYKDWTGKRCKKTKRGFKTKKAANEWEVDFLRQMEGTPDMTLNAFYDLYFATKAEGLGTGLPDQIAMFHEEAPRPCSDRHRHAADDQGRWQGLQLLVRLQGACQPEEIRRRARHHRPANPPHAKDGRQRRDEHRIRHQRDHRRC